MIRIILFVFSLIATSTVFSQTASVEDRRQELQKQISAGLIENRIEDVVKAGTELAEIEKGLGDANLPNYAVALTNLALWKERLTGTASTDLTSNVRWSRNSGEGLAPDVLKDLRRLKSEIRSHFEEVVGLYRTKIDDPRQLSSVLLEYGDFRCRESTENDELPSVPKPLRESLTIRDRTNPPDSDPIINALVRLSECEFNTGNFAEYYEAHKRLAAIIEKRFGNESKRLLRPLLTFERFLILTDRTTEAGEVLNRISTITGGLYTNSKPDDIVMLRFVGRINLSFGRKTTPSSDYPNGIAVPNPTNATRNDTVIISKDANGRPTVSRIPGSTTTTTRIPIDQGGTRRVTRWGVIHLPVAILVDASGAVVDANAQIGNKAIKKTIEKKVMEWKFRPLVIDGAGQKMRGTVFVDYGY